MRRTVRHPVRLPARLSARFWVPLLIAALAVLAGPAQAMLECELPEDRRRLQIEIPGEQHLCEVAVVYQSGERRVLWYADNDTTFCNDKLDELERKYTDEWGFACTDWPDDDGIAELAPGQRRALDRALRERLERTDASIAAVRVATAPPAADGSVLVAVQWLGQAEGDAATDALDVYTDASPADRDTGTADWRPLVSTDDVVALLPRPADDVTIARALLTGIDAGGALALTTVVEPTAGSDQICRGRQRLTLDADGGFDAATPHRHACEAILADAD